MSCPLVFPPLYILATTLRIGLIKSFFGQFPQFLFYRLLNFWPNFLLERFQLLSLLPDFACMKVTPLLTTVSFISKSFSGKYPSRLFLSSSRPTPLFWIRIPSSFFGYDDRKCNFQQVIPDWARLHTLITAETHNFSDPPNMKNVYSMPILIALVFIL